MIHVEEYLAAHDKRQIRNGKSGAQVWELEGGHVLKWVRREELPDPGAFALYQNEAVFYREFGQGAGRECSWMPEVLEVQTSDERIVILMKKYQALSGTEMTEEVLRDVLGTLAEIHGQEIPAFLRRKRREPGYLTEEQAACCLEGWRSVLAEHPGAFDEEILTEAAAKINEIIGWHHGEAQGLTHGDFHWENLLRRENGDIVVCDWQGVGTGGASGDISFFLSRLGADGTDIEPGKAAEIYCRERLARTGDRVTPAELLGHMQAANLITSFQFWHEYLHGSSCERVRGIYEKMRFNGGCLPGKSD